MKVDISPVLVLAPRCLAAHEALRLGSVFLQALIDEYGDTPVTEQLRLLEAV